MKKQFLFLLTFIFVSQFVLADGAKDTDYDTARDTKCSELYFSVIKLKIKRPEAIPFTINALGGKVEFSTGNLQYQAKTNTFRFATRQWEYVGDGSDTASTQVLWDSTVVEVVKDPTTGEPVLDAEGKEQTELKVYPAISDNRRISKSYMGWIDLFGWATSGFNPNSKANYDLGIRQDSLNTCTKPYSTSTVQVSPTYNEWGYGPSVGLTGKVKDSDTRETILSDIDTNSTVSRNYDWGYYNDIYCKWVGFDTTKEEGNTGKDSIGFDSTMFNAGIWRTLTDTEWNYMLFTRKVENKKAVPWAYVKIAAAAGGEFPGNEGSSDPLGLTIARGVEGLLIFPDDFEKIIAVKAGWPAGRAIPYGQLSYANLTYAEFIALEKVGVIFLPGRIIRESNVVKVLNATSSDKVSYWSATKATSGSAKAFLWPQGAVAAPSLVTTSSLNKYRGCYVRLVRDLDAKQDHPASIYQ